MNRLLVIVIIIACALSNSAHAVSNTFTYQGSLNDGGNPANGSYDLEFQLQTSSGASVGAALVREDVAVIGGLFAVELDFGAAITGADFRLQIGVRPGASTGAYTILSPTTAIRPAPQAQVAGLAAEAVTVSANAVTSTGIADGSVTLADINPNFVQTRVDGSCAAGSSIRVINSNGTVSCETDDGSGTVTSVASGAGLTGGPITGSGTLSIASGGVTGAMLADGTVANVDLAANAVNAGNIVDGSIGSAEINSAQVQRRITGSCASGIGTVNADGTVVCVVPTIDSAAVALAYPNARDASFSTAGAGVGDTAMAIGLDGLPLIAFHDDINNDLVTLHCSDPACTATTRTSIDTTGNVGRRPRIAIAGSGAAPVPVISYFDQDNNVLKLARCSDAACSSATVVTIAATAGAGAHHALVDAGASVGVLFYDVANGNLRGISCTVATLACNAPFNVDDSANDVGRDVALSPGMQLGIAYRNATTGNLMLKRCAAVSVCSTALSSAPVTLVADGSVAEVLGHATLNDGRSIVLYRNLSGEARTVACLNAFCTGGGAAQPVSSALIGAQPGFGDISVGLDGLPLVFLTPVDSSARSISKCAVADCSSYVGAAGLTGGADTMGMAAVARSARDIPYATYSVGDSLRLVICENRNCDANGRR